MVHAVTESVDVLPTICDFMGVAVPLGLDGWSLGAFTSGQGAPEHWRDTAHYEWNFSNPATLDAERGFGIPMSHCSLAVSRGRHVKYVQFATGADLYPPLVFDLDADPDQLENLCLSKEGDWQALAWEGSQELLRWHMRSAEHTLSGQLVGPETGLAVARDTWR